MNASRIDLGAARRRFGQAAPTYVEGAVLAREVQRRMAERLDYIRYSPAAVLDAGCGTGEGLRLLRMRYPKSLLVGLDVAHAMTRSARRSRTLLGRTRDLFTGFSCHHLCGDFSRLPLGPATVGMVWSNLALAWAEDPLPAFSELARVLAPSGLLMFSTYGPDTLKELRSAFTGIDNYAHVHHFIDMHDLGDMLLTAGFAEPVMDMEIVSMSYPDVAALVRDLRLSGQSNVDVGRRRGLMAPGAWNQMVAALETTRSNGRLTATFEIVYGHAWKAAARTRADGVQVVKTDFALNKAR
ncbi:MAG: malonyl-[acyl-carrier protein] O-methyltransferase BioC [Betaproteobacteria bacterium RIFCSPLOWO2_12_FULL_63_13]|nr:MAG: malonyl-[acyl-carrier protein] O-methyltransferase BioC [Betaproteobacteria bacterium RIFCSPLOWO2_02_FULL_63_19]OGA43699.1 MAG: malonyl-[acyl-carrier protein] O-methyltransferase BioC [Betaproteobacteria bacterium RIFCSPLOWO2_12_FULL_63_13]